MDIDCILSAVLTQRLEDVVDIDLVGLLRGDVRLRQASRQLTEMLFNNRRSLGLFLATARSARRDLILAASQAMQRFLTTGYQYIDLREVDNEVLAGVYQALFTSMSSTVDAETPRQLSQQLSALLRQHHDRLRAWVDRELSKAGVLHLVQSRSKLPLCEQYDPLLQLNAFGISPEYLGGPVLDLGCGSEGRLVNHFRRLGISTVMGIDQNANPASGLLRGSWFEVPLPPSFWSLVTAHHSFSLHFLQAHLASSQRAATYARHYMKILASLRIGGRFCYAPGLPFLEPLIPRDRYRITTRHLAADAVALPPPAIHVLFGETGPGTTTVQRIA